jgi:hypothetical protein
MIIIRNNQLEKFREARAKTHVATVSDILAASFPAARNMPVSVRHATIERKLKEGRAAGITRQDDSARYAGLAFVSSSEPALAAQWSPVIQNKSAVAAKRLDLAYRQVCHAKAADDPIRQALQSFDAAASKVFLSLPIDTVVLPCGATQSWIEIELCDLLGRPVGSERYCIKTPDGELIEGQLDEVGVARVDGIEAGDCIISFPDLDRRVIERVAQAGRPLVSVQ